MGGMWGNDRGVIALDCKYFRTDKDLALMAGNVIHELGHHANDIAVPGPERLLPDNAKLEDQYQGPGYDAQLECMGIGR